MSHKEAIMNLKFDIRLDGRTIAGGLYGKSDVGSKA